MSKSQQEMLATIAESSARLSTIWAESLKKTRPSPLWERYKEVMANWINPWSAPGDGTPSDALSRFQKVIDQTARDLPELIEEGANKEKVKRIKERWTKSYQQLVRETFGIRPGSEARQLVDRWNELLRAPSQGRSFPRSDPFPDLAALFPSMKWLFPAADATQWQFPDAWRDTYMRNVGNVFQGKGKGFPSDLEDLVKVTLDSQVEFLNSISKLHRQLLSAADTGIDKLIEKVTEFGIQSVTPDTYSRFQKAWIAAHEEAFADLFKSGALGNAAVNTIEKAMEANTKMDGLMSQVLASWNIPTRKEMETVRDEVASLREEVARLGEQIEAVKRMLEAQTQAGKQ